MTVTYFETFLGPYTCKEYFSYLIEKNDWEYSSASARKVKWYGPKPYSYSKYYFAPVEMPGILRLVSNLLYPIPNGVLVNYYPNGNFGIGWHSDSEFSLVKGMPISIISLGAERLFRMRRKDRTDSKEFLLKEGSLLTMEGDTQDRWEHYIPRNPCIKEPRISLTFRHV